MPKPETAQCAHCGAIPGPILFARVKAATQVLCNFCGAAGPLESTEAYAIAVWNRRTPPQPDGTDWSTPLTPEMQAYLHDKHVGPIPSAQPAPTVWTGNVDADAALVMLDRLDVSSDDDARVDEISAIVRRLATPAATQPAPIDMVLHCPACGKQHIDRPEYESGNYGRMLVWDNPPHRSHQCHGCGCIWRPADVPTNGVVAAATKGKADTWDATQRTTEESSAIAAIVSAAQEWWGERTIKDWSEADLAKAVIQHDGDWPGCEGCDFECGEPCTPATVPEMLHSVDCQIAQLVHEGKLAKPIDYAPPAGWTPIERPRKRSGEELLQSAYTGACARITALLRERDQLQAMLSARPAGQEAFELWYADHWKKATRKAETIAELAAVLVTMRDGDHYHDGDGGAVPYIDALWQCWQSAQAGGGK